jgi:hypothetical protein
MLSRDGVCLRLARPLHSRCSRVTDRLRIIVLLTDRVEAALVADWLADDGFEPIQRPNASAALAEMRAHPFDLLIADAGTDRRLVTHARECSRRPLTPVILIGDAAPPTRGAVTSADIHLARPISRALLGCYVSIAMLEGNPVRRSARKLVNPFEAEVNGLPSHIIDISTEGVRLEMPPDRRAALPPFFTVRVPLIGVGVGVRRVWTRTSTGATHALWYGAALTPNRASAVQGWRSFVESIPTAASFKSV